MLKRDREPLGLHSKRDIEDRVSSNKQRKYMNWAASKGKIKKSVVNEFNQASEGMKLSESAPVPKKTRYTDMMKKQI